MNNKEILSAYLKSDLNRRYCQPIINQMLQANFRKGQFVIKAGTSRLAVAPNEIEEKAQEIVEFMVRKALLEGYNSLVVPSIVSRDQAPNFYFIQEKPQEDEVWYLLSLLLTGIHTGILGKGKQRYVYILNFVNVPEELLSDFREWLRNKNQIILTNVRSGLNFNEIFITLNLPKGIPFEEFIIAFIFLSCFAKFWKEKWQEKRLATEFGKKLTALPQDSSLVLHVLSRQKKKLYIFPKLGEILVNYYDDFFTSDDLIPSISRFVFSLYIADKDYKEKSAKLLNKFLYYMLEGKINGELLSNAIEMKTTYELKKKDEKVYGLLYASKFFAKL